VKESVSQKYRNWYRNEVDEETNGADSRDKMKHNDKRHKLFFERMMKVAEREKRRMKSEYREDVERR